jgi:nitrogen fixation protein NifU and related proteins
MDKTTIELLQNHSVRFLEMAFRTDRDETIHHPDAWSKNTGDCGDSIEIFLTIDRESIVTVSFRIDGCLNTRAAANMMGDMIEKKTIAQAWKLTPEKLAGALETLPEESFHCAELAVGALYKALSTYKTLSQNPWKRNYLRS